MSAPLRCVLETERWSDLRVWSDESSNHVGAGPFFPEFTIHERSVSFEESPSARLRGLRPGPYRFKVFPPDVAIAPETIEVAGPATAPVEIRWTAASGAR